MKKVVVLILFAIVVFAQETLIKVDLNRRARNNLVTLFEEMPHKIEVYVDSDSIYIVEAIYPGNKIVRRLSPSEYKSLILKEPDKRVIIEDAQLPYLIGQSIHGIGLYSWSVPLAFDMEGEGAISLGLLVPLLYSGGTYLLTKDRRISGGAAYGSFLGGIEGAYHGGLLFNSKKGILPVSLVENFLDFTLAQKMGLNSGVFQRKFNHCFYGYYHYSALKTLALADDWDNWDEEEEFYQVSSLLSLFEGYSSLFFSRNSEDLTLGDALFELRTGVMGAEALPLLLATYDLHSDVNISPSVYAGLSLLGHGAGYMLGNKLSREFDLSGAGGVMIWLLPALAHGFTGSLVFLSDSEGLARTYPTIFLTTDVLLTYFCYRNFAEKPLKTGQANTTPHFNLALNPLSFVCKDKNKTFENMPFMMFSYEF
jgi:hypothetical protein